MHLFTSPLAAETICVYFLVELDICGLAWVFSGCSQQRWGSEEGGVLLLLAAPWLLVERLFLLQRTGFRRLGFSGFGTETQYLWRMGLVAPQHVESSGTKDQICVPLHWQVGSYPVRHLKNLDKSQNKAITKVICGESRLGVVGQEQSPLVSHCLLMAQQTFIYQIFAFLSLNYLPSL